MSPKARRSAGRRSTASADRSEKALALLREEGRRQAEHWLDVNRQLDETLIVFKSLYEEAPVAYLTLNESGIVVDANRQAVALLRCEPDALRDRPLVFFVEGTATAKFLTYLASCRSGAATVRTQIAFRRGEHDRVQVELVGRRTWLPGGLIVYQTVVNDLTERRASERRLAASEKQYREIVETANEGICKVDASNQITFVNHAFCRLTGYAEEELTGRPLESLVAREDVEAERAGFSRRDIGRLGVREVRLRRADGSVVWTSASSNLVLDEEGNFAGILRMHTDITDRKQLEAARDKLVRDLVSAQEAERQRVARELHDQMGQHLVGLSLGLNRLAQLGAQSPEVTNIISRLQSVAETMARDVQHLAFELRPASLDDLGLADAVSNYADGVGKRFGLEVDVQCDRMIRLDSSAEIAIYRIVQEALTNVAKHAKARRVSVILEPRGDRLQVIVEDDGIGFRPELVGLNDSRLGLRGMTERASLVGGEIQIESRPGRGTTLFLRVPMRRREKASHEEAESAAG